TAGLTTDAAKPADRALPCGTDARASGRDGVPDPAPNRIKRSKARLARCGINGLGIRIGPARLVLSLPTLRLSIRNLGRLTRHTRLSRATIETHRRRDREQQQRARNRAHARSPEKALAEDVVCFQTDHGFF